MKRAELQFYIGEDVLWRWRFVARNSKILADSGEGYASKQMAMKGFKSMIRSVAPKTVVNGRCSNIVIRNLEEEQK